MQRVNASGRGSRVRGHSANRKVPSTLEQGRLVARVASLADTCRRASGAVSPACRPPCRCAEAAFSWTEGCRMTR